MTRWLAIARVVPLLAYPFIVYLALGRVDARYLGIVVVGLLVLRNRSRLGNFAQGMAPLMAIAGAVALLYAGIVWWSNSEQVLRLYPALINLGALGLFAWSLHRPPSMVERFARLHHPDLPPEGVRYTVNVTRVWCGFFILNGAIATYTAVFSSRAVWTLYNGLIAYVLMGVLFAGEWWVRRRVMPPAAAV